MFLRKLYARKAAKTDEISALPNENTTKNTKNCL